ncbi:MAG TPA: PEGA domain-containing protein [Minicystis sp.]|nr:PEGA domain-containing protein [Minicystis sp.]
MKQGDGKFAARDFKGALKDYQAANAIMQVPSTGLPLAKTQIELGMLVEARDTLLAVTRSPKQPGEPAAFAKAREEAGPLAQKLADRIPSLSISVEGPANGAAQVAIDGAAVPPDTLGTPRKVNPGTHVVTVTSPGYESATRNVIVKEGESAKLSIDLRPGTASGAPAGGGTRLHIVSPAEPGNVIIDGKASGATPLDLPISPGAHKIEIEYPGGSRDERSVDVRAGKTADVEFRPSTIDALARYRRGVHLGLAVGPEDEVFLNGGTIYNGGTIGLVVNIGITPTFDFGTGVAAAGFYTANGNGSGEATLLVPAMLRVHVAPWFLASAGGTAGAAFGFKDLANAISNGKTFAPTFIAGPEWQLLMLGGDKREFEVGLEQGFHFGGAPVELHQMLMFSYLSLD